MNTLIRQSLKPKKMGIWKLITITLIILFFLNFILELTVQIHSIATASILVLSSITFASYLCFIFIYKNLSIFEYKLINNDLILERALGRANHVVYPINKKQVIEILPYLDWNSNKKISWLNYLTINKDKSKWYVVSFMHNNKPTQLVIEPDDVFLKGLLNFHT